MNQINLLSVLAILFVNTTLVMAIIYYSFEPRWIASYIAVVLLYSALYFRRSTDLSEDVLRRRLGKAAITLGLFLTALFFYNFTSGLPWWVAVTAWLMLAAAAFFVYDIIMFHDEEAAPLVQLQGRRPPV